MLCCKTLKLVSGTLSKTGLTCCCFDNNYVGKQPVAWKEYCVEYWLKELQESMDRCTGCHDITEILLETALSIIQSIIQSINQPNVAYKGF